MMCGSTTVSFSVLLTLFVLVQSDVAKVPVRVDELTKISARAWRVDFLKENEPCKKRGDYGYPRCSPGLWCLGKDKLTCQKRADWRESCSDDPYRCGDQLTCENGICVDKLLPYPETLYIEGGRPCGMNSYQRCRPGFWCIARACRRLVRCGGRCDKIRFVCRPGLTCHHIARKRYRFCRPISGRQKVKHGGERCKIDGTPCKTGFKCVIRAGVGTCRRPCRIGRPCGGKESDCERGRECKVKNGMRKCIQIMELGETCADKFSLYCKTGLTCSCKPTDRCTTGKCVKF